MGLAIEAAHNYSLLPEDIVGIDIPVAQFGLIFRDRDNAVVEENK
jgi:hypothetical protein